MYYLEKYLKYKTKYMILKSQTGGDLNCDEMKIIFNVMDSNNDGNITEAEFLEFFMVADSDNSKSVSLNELQSYLNKLLSDLFQLIKHFSGSKEESISTTNLDLIFSKMDKSGDGKINSLEFVQACNSAQISNTQNITRLFNFLDTSSIIGIERDRFDNVIKALIIASDTNKDNSVSKTEFVAKINSIASDIFKAFDSNKDGDITEAELKTAFKNFSGQDLQLSKDEFVNMMKSVSNCNKM